MSALFAYISTNPAGPFICMGIIVAIVLGVKAAMKIKKNEDVSSIGTGEDDGDSAPGESGDSSHPAE